MRRRLLHAPGPALGAWTRWSWHSALLWGGKEGHLRPPRAALPVLEQLRGLWGRRVHRSTRQRHRGVCQDSPGSWRSPERGPEGTPCPRAAPPSPGRAASCLCPDTSQQRSRALSGPLCWLLSLSGDPDMELREEAWSPGPLDSEDQQMASHENPVDILIMDDDDVPSWPPTKLSRPVCALGRRNPTVLGVLNTGHPHVAAAGSFPLRSQQERWLPYYDPTRSGPHSPVENETRNQVKSLPVSRDCFEGSRQCL
nr:zinc finger protein 787 [Vicugna pacos]